MASSCWALTVRSTSCCQQALLYYGDDVVLMCQFSACQACCYAGNRGFYGQQLQGLSVRKSFCCQSALPCFHVCLMMLRPFSAC